MNLAHSVPTVASRPHGTAPSHAGLWLFRAKRRNDDGPLSYTSFHETSRCHTRVRSRRVLATTTLTT